MFEITATRPITWTGFSLRKGSNQLPSTKAVPAELWPKLARFRELEIVAFDLELGGDCLPKEGHQPVKLEELTERQLFDLTKADLAELAKANGIKVPVAPGAEGPSKKALLDALVQKAKPLAKLEEPAGTGESKSATADKRGSKAVTVESST